MFVSCLHCSSSQIAKRLLCKLLTNRTPAFLPLASLHFSLPLSCSLSDTLWACAMLDEKPGKQWLDCFLCESRKLLPAFPSGALVTVLWSLALLQHRPPSDWMARCLTAVSSCLEASKAAAAAAAAGRLNGSSSRLLQKPQLPGTYSSAAAGSAAGSWGYLFTDTPNMQQQQQQQVVPLSPQQVTRLAWALATLDCQLPAQLMQQLSERAEALVGQLDSDNLAQLVWALDRLDDTPEKMWVRQFAATARAQLLASHSGGFAAGFRPLSGTAGFSLPGFGVQQSSALKHGQVVLVKPARHAAMQQPAAAAAASGPAGLSRGAAAAAAAGITVQKEIVAELQRVGFGSLRGASKQEMLAKLKQMRQAAE
jgi:hypothetical protein